MQDAFVPPHSIEAEQSTLGAMLIERTAVEKVVEILGKEDFYRENHQTLFDVITFLADQGEPIDLVAVPNELKSRGQLDAIGGMAYLAALFDTVPTAANVEYYAKIVKEKSQRREVIAIALQLQHEACDANKELLAAVQHSQNGLTRATVAFVRWEPPIPFSAHQPPAFPVEVLPRVVGHFVSEVAASVQVPVDMAAMLGLGVVAAAASRTCRVQLGQTHSEPMNLFVLSIMEPGARKSAALEAMVAPLRAAERDEVIAKAPEIEEARDQQKTHEKRVAHLQEVVAKGNNDKPENADKARQELHDLRNNPPQAAPPMPKFLVDDVTPEQLAGVMAEQEGVITLASAEGGFFATLGGRYSNGTANLDVVLKGHAGEEVRVDRKGSPPVFIASACLTMLLAVQPDVLSSFADTPAFRGRGLLGRFLYTQPENLAGTRYYENRPIDAEARRRYEGAVKAILTFHRSQNPETPGERHLLHIEGDALAGWSEYANEVERRQGPGEDLAGVRDWASKLAGAVARIAGGLHLLENVGRDCPWNIPISPETILAAWAIGDYLIAHALAAFGSMGVDPNVSLATRLLGWIARKGLTEFSLRECHQAHRNVGTPQGLEPGLRLLCERGYLRQKGGQPRAGRGQAKSPVFEVNPLYTHTQNTHE